MKLRKKRRKLNFFLLALPFLLVGGLIFFLVPERPAAIEDIVTRTFPTASPTPMPLPQSHIIPQRLHVFQSFNNCGPVTLSMALSYFGIDKPQNELGQILRPYQVAGGDNDDKSVTLHEVAAQAETYDLISYLRPNGDIEKLKRFLANDIPVVTRTWLKTDEDIGHYRVVRGFDDATGQIIQDDSLQGKNLRYSYNDFLKLWQPFNYEYLVIIEKGKKELVEAILGEELEDRKAWENSLLRNENEQQNDPANWHLTFARSRIYYYLSDFGKSVEEFDKVESRLSFRTLWYQIEPIRAMYELKDYDRVLSLTQRILNNQNRAFSELYIIRGDIFKSQGDNNAARSEYEKAVMYNRNNNEAQSRLNSI